MKTYDINTVEQQLLTQDTVASFTSGASMRPLLRKHKDIVIISKPVSSLAVGDVVLYRVKGVEKLILHRIIGIKSDGTCIIRGDNTYVKEYVPQENIIGVMTSLYRSGKYIDCESSKRYKIYVKLNRFFYPVRWLWKTKIRVFLSKIKRKLLK